MPGLSLGDIRNLVDTVVMVMLENRSFDHMLGHMSYRQYDVGRRVEGLTDPLNREEYWNLYAGQPYYPFEMRDGVLPSDLPHDRDEIAQQIGYSPVSGRCTMRGFVEAYYAKTTVNWSRTPEPMGFYPPGEVPITAFLANNFAVCDQWFSPLPTSTLPNRLMAWTGSSRVDHTGMLFPSCGPTFLDWLSQRGVRWRVYHDGLSFFALLGEFGKIFGPDFRRFEELARDVANEPAATFPQVILIEPSYADAPHLGTDLPNDNHPPLPVRPGEQFLGIIYQALTVNPARWARTVWIVYYDEHGGFYDHVPPLPIPYDPRPEAAYPPFTTTGPRVPAVVVSPLIASRTVHKEMMDHTSILQFLAELFAPNETGYSDVVNARRNLGITSVSRVLNLDRPRTAMPPLPAVAARSFLIPQESPENKRPLQTLFEKGAEEMVTNHEAETSAQYPEVWHWCAARASGVT